MLFEVQKRLTLGVVEYVLYYQGPAAIATVLAVGITHIILATPL